MLAGVCAGYAKHFAKDVRIVRVIWTLAALIPPFFPGVAAYLVSWLLMPAPKDSAPAKAAASD
jgi:phage shock protein PspC (stress-responsive transcriptional regulator)